MIGLILAVSSGFKSLETRFLELDGLVAVQLLNSHQDPVWMLLDSGGVETFVSAKKAPNADGTMSLPIGQMSMTFEAVVSSTYDAQLRSLGVDGILGSDALERMAVFIDYRSRKVWARNRYVVEKADALDSALEASQRPPEAISRIELNRSANGWYRAEAHRGKISDSVVFDTGNSGFTLSASSTGLGRPIGVVGVEGVAKSELRSTYLDRVSFPGTETVPSIVSQGSGSLPSRIGPYGLTHEWVLLDLPEGYAVVPKLNPLASARRILEFALSRRDLPERMSGNSIDSVLGEIANVSSDAGLEKARLRILALLRDAKRSK